ncbi:MAG: arginine--tRNA ligase, partial [Thermodesulfobacteriota bacterium]|nr:arginine--tRNA ligase [Thermodesulfobacteriota bacterium]
DDIPPLVWEVPRNEKHGDIAINFPLLLAKKIKQPPVKIAQSLVRFLSSDIGIEKVEVAGPGFINFFFKADFWHQQLKEIQGLGHNYGKLNWGEGEKVLVEYVSANPTGPLHIGHGRGAAVGEALANLMSAVGYKVTREYYINDVGTQMEILGRSLLFRYFELLNRAKKFPENHYQGEYIIDIAKEIISKFGGEFLNLPEEEAISFFNNYGKDYILQRIRKDLKDFKINFDLWASEEELHKQGAIEGTIEELKNSGWVYKKDGALWFKSQKLGDDKDRVLIKENGDYTYFASDIAYHRNKIKRGFKRIINVWGADHHGYIPRLKAAIKVLSQDGGIALEVVLVQLVNLQRKGVPVVMSTRQGEFITLQEVIDEVGEDSARYIFLTRRTDAHLDFDLETAQKQNDENPVYYVQYAHARICQIIKFAEERGFTLKKDNDIVDLSPLKLPYELALIKKLSFYPQLISNSARALEPHRVTGYLQELVSLFHNYYHQGKVSGKKRVVTEDKTLSLARLYLVDAMRIVIRNALNILGVNAPEKM